MALFIGDRTRLKVAILDAVPGNPNDLKSNEISLSREQGALLAGELSIYTNKAFDDDQKTLERSYETRRRKVGRQFDVYKKDKINVGGWYYTGEFDPLKASTASFGNYGIYVGAQKYIPIGDGADFVALFGRAGIAKSKFNRLGSALSGGFIMSNPLTGIDDSFGLAFSSGFNGKEFEEIQNSSETTETALEFTYSLPIKTWFLLQPDVQYIIVA